MDVAELMKLEDVLHFFHVDCRSALASAVAEDDRTAFFANVDLTATEHFYQSPVAKRIQAVLQALAPYYFQIQDANVDKPMPAPGDDKLWITFSRDAAEEVTKKKTTGKEAKVPVAALEAVVMQHDEDGHGRLRTSQPVREKEEPKGPMICELHWKNWLGLDLSMVLGRVEADIATAVAVLRMLKTRESSQRAVPIKMEYNATEKVLRVLATGPIKKGSLVFAPCIQKLKIHEQSSNPRRVPITVRRTGSEGASRAAVAACMEATAVPPPTRRRANCKTKAETNPETEAVDDKKEYYIHPEFKMPELNEDGTWKMAEDTSIYPYWAIRRLNAEQVKKMQQDDASDTKPADIRFNFGVEPIEFATCSIGVIQGDSLSNTVFVTLPMLTNTCDLASGEELLVETIKKEKDTKSTPKITWKEEAMREEKKNKGKNKREEEKDNGKNKEENKEENKCSHKKQKILLL